MSNCISIVLAALVCALLGTTALAAAKKPADVWTYYHFDGSAFQAGPSTDGSAFVAMRAGVRPVVLQGQPGNIEPVELPEDSGVIAGICYFQSSGGKLGGTASYVPCPHAPLLVSSGGKPFVAVQTDENGYFVTVLPAGKYTIGSGVFTDEITVDRGATTLIPLRAGKRMVD